MAMTCPNCAHKWPRYTSMKIMPGRPLDCPTCGRKWMRAGKLQPLLIVVGALLGYHQLIGSFAFSPFGSFMALAAVLILALTIDELTIRLVPAPGTGAGRGDG